MTAGTVRHNELIKRLWRIKCQSNLERWQIKLSGNPWSWCDSQLPRLSLESWLFLRQHLQRLLIIFRLPSSILLLNTNNFNFFFFHRFSDAKFNINRICKWKHKSSLKRHSFGIVSHLCVYAVLVSCLFGSAGGPWIVTKNCMINQADFI